MSWSDRSCRLCTLVLVLHAAAARAEGTDPPAPAPPAPRPGFASMNPDLSFILGTAFAWFSDDEPLQTGAHDPRKTGFNWQQLEAAVTSAVDPYFKLDAFIVFGQVGVEVEEAYATSLSLPWNLQLRVGQFLTRMGRLNSTHPHAWDFVDQPFALGRVMGGEGNRGLGGEMSFLAPLPWYVEAVLSVTDPAGEGTARSFYGGADLGISSPFDFQITLALKQFFPFSDAFGLAWGLSAAAGPNPTGRRNRTEITGTDVYLKFRPVGGSPFTTVALQSEWFYRRRQVPGDVLSDVNGYAHLSWRFAQRWSTAVRYELGSPTFDRDGGVADDPLDPFWTAYRSRYAWTVTFGPTEFSRVRLQVSLDDAGWRRDPGYGVFFATEFLVGAHGAHPF